MINLDFNLKIFDKNIKGEKNMTYIYEVKEQDAQLTL